MRANDGDPAAGGGDAMSRRADQAAFEHQVVRTRSLPSNRVIQPTPGLLGIERYITIGDSDRLIAPPQRPVARHTDRSNGQAVARDYAPLDPPCRTDLYSAGSRVALSLYAATH